MTMGVPALTTCGLLYEVIGITLGAAKPSFLLLFMACGFLI
jgi:hypothetical protein